jgi:hypothetical protein
VINTITLKPAKYLSGVETGRYRTGTQQDRELFTTFVRPLRVVHSSSPSGEALGETCIQLLQTEVQAGVEQYQRKARTLTAEKERLLQDVMTLTTERDRVKKDEERLLRDVMTLTTERDRMKKDEERQIKKLNSRIEEIGEMLEKAFDARDLSLRQAASATKQKKRKAVSHSTAPQDKGRSFHMVRPRSI